MTGWKILCSFSLSHKKKTKILKKTKKTTKENNPHIPKGIHQNRNKTQKKTEQTPQKKNNKQL